MNFFRPLLFAVGVVLSGWCAHADGYKLIGDLEAAAHNAGMRADYEEFARILLVDQLEEVAPGTRRTVSRGLEFVFEGKSFRFDNISVVSEGQFGSRRLYVLSNANDLKKTMWMYLILYNRAGDWFPLHFAIEGSYAKLREKM